MDLVRGPVREMMREIGAPYAHSFPAHTIQMYQLPEEDIMQISFLTIAQVIVSAIFIYGFLCF